MISKFTWPTDPVQMFADFVNVFDRGNFILVELSRNSVNTQDERQTRDRRNTWHGNGWRSWFVPALAISSFEKRNFWDTFQVQRFVFRIVALRNVQTARSRMSVQGWVTRRWRGFDLNSDAKSATLLRTLRAQGSVVVFVPTVICNAVRRWIDGGIVGCDAQGSGGRRRRLRHFSGRALERDPVGAHVLVGGDADGVDVNVEETQVN